MKKGNVAIVVILLVTAALIVGAYYLGKQSDKMSISEANISSPTPNPSPSAISVTAIPKLTSKYDYAGWQTYTDSKAGFSIGYSPQEKILDKKEGEFVYFSRYRVVVYSDYDGGSRRQWFNSKFDTSTYQVAYEDYSVFRVNALIIKLSDPGSMGSTNVVIPRGREVYLYSASSGSESLDITKQIISTFKFL